MITTNSYTEKKLILELDRLSPTCLHVRRRNVLAQGKFVMLVFSTRLLRQETLSVVSCADGTEVALLILIIYFKVKTVFTLK